MDKGSVRCGAVVPHNPRTVTEQRYTRFEGWVSFEPHHIPDYWLIAFKNPYENHEDKIVIKEIHWGWREWTILGPIWCFLAYVSLKFLAIFYGFN
jgi:hypothetical protein